MVVTWTEKVRRMEQVVSLLKEKEFFYIYTLGIMTNEMEYVIVNTE